MNYASSPLPTIINAFLLGWWGYWGWQFGVWLLGFIRHG